MDHLKFGRLVSFVVARTGGTELDMLELDMLSTLVNNCHPESVPTLPSLRDTAVDVRAMLRAMATAGQKIEAIKLYRALTGDGVRDSKDAIEAAMRLPAHT